MTDIDGTLADALRRQEVDDFEASSNFASCLMPLLSALGWDGNTRELMEALPHFARRLDLIDLRNSLSELGFESRRNKGRLRNLDRRLLPCLFLPGDKPPMVVHTRDEKGFAVFDSKDHEVKHVGGRGLKGYYYTLERKDEQAERKRETRSFTWLTVRRFWAAALIVAAASVLTSLFGLAVPLFVIAIYDIVIPATSVESLYWLVPGVVIALVADLLLRRIRTDAVAHVAGRLDYLVSTETFRRVLELPPASSDTANLGAQLSRLKSFQSVRDLVNSPIANTVLEMPLTIAAMILIGAVAGSLVIIPLVGILAFVILGIIFIPAIQRAESDAGRAKANRDQLLTELVTHQRAAREAVIEDSLFDRMRPLSARMAVERSRANMRMLMLQTLSHTVVQGTGLLTLLVGTISVINETMTTGALVASMTLIWRALAPVQIGFQALPRLTQIRSTFDQLNRLMRTPAEPRGDDTEISEHRFANVISIRRVSMRYKEDADPALLAVSTDIQPGELIALTGPSGAGKSTLLKIVAGVLKPQAGSVFYGGVEQRQLRATEMRKSIAYLPQACHLFHGTISQNLRLVEPAATDEMLREAASAAGVLEEIANLPDGFETWIGDEKLESLPESFQQKLGLTRLWLKDAPILLLDEPSQNLDAVGEEAFARTLESLRGKRTIVFVSHRPSQMRAADRVLVLTAGRLTSDTKNENNEAIESKRGAA